MSGIKKAVKKVFRGAKKVLKKVAKPALIIGGTFFASGLALGGFKGFTSLMESSGSIFSAVGKTMAAGAQAIGGALGIGEGVSAELLGDMGLAEGTTLGSGAFAQTLGFGTPETASSRIGPGNLPDYLKSQGMETAAKEVGKEQVSGGVLGRIFGGINKLSDPAQTALFTGISTGLSAWAQSEEAEKERKRQRRRGIFGVPIGEEFGSGVSPEQMVEAVQKGYQAAPPMTYPAQGVMPPMPQPSPQPYSNPYTNQPTPPAATGPLLG